MLKIAENEHRRHPNNKKVVNVGGTDDLYHTENTGRFNNCSGRWLRLGTGEPICIGFSNNPIWGDPDENGDAKGFVNEIAFGILKEMATKISRPS